jgi:hypothetical protein
MSETKDGERRGRNTTKRRLKAAERQRQALQMRIRNATFDQIAKTLGYRSPSGAYKAVMCALKKTLQEPADELRLMEYERLNLLYREVLARALTLRDEDGNLTQIGDMGAIDRCIRISDRISKLMGLDAPQHVVYEDWRDYLRRNGLSESAISERFEEMVQFFYEAEKEQRE